MKTWLHGKLLPWMRDSRSAWALMLAVAFVLGYLTGHAGSTSSTDTEQPSSDTPAIDQLLKDLQPVLASVRDDDDDVVLNMLRAGGWRGLGPPPESYERMMLHIVTPDVIVRYVLELSDYEAVRFMRWYLKDHEAYMAEVEEEAG